MTAAVLEPRVRAHPAAMTAVAPPRPLRRSPVPIREPRAASRVTRAQSDRDDLSPPGTVTLLLPIDLSPDEIAESRRANRRRRRRAPDGNGDGPLDGGLDGGLDGDPEDGTADGTADSDENSDENCGPSEVPGDVRDGGEGTGLVAGDLATSQAYDGTIDRRAAGIGEASATRNTSSVQARRPAGVRLGSPPTPAAVVHPVSELELGEAKAWANTFLQAAMEVATGIRSPAQLVRWTTPEVHGLLVRRGSLASRARHGAISDAKPRIRALLSCTPRDGICEIGAVVAETERIRAVAFRMEGLHGRWRVTELVIG